MASSTDAAGLPPWICPCITRDVFNLRPNFIKQRSPSSGHPRYTRCSNHFTAQSRTPGLGTFSAGAGKFLGFRKVALSTKRPRHEEPELPPSQLPSAKD